MLKVTRTARYENFCVALEFEMLSSQFVEFVKTDAFNCPERIVRNSFELVLNRAFNEVKEALNDVVGASVDIFNNRSHYVRLYDPELIPRYIVAVLETLESDPEYLNGMDVRLSRIWIHLEDHFTSELIYTIEQEFDKLEKKDGREAEE